MEPSSKAIELFLSESDKSAPPTIEALISQLEAGLQSLRHGLGVVAQKLQDLAELRVTELEEAKHVARS